MRAIFETLYSIDEHGPKTGFSVVAEAATHYRSFKLSSSVIAKEFALQVLGDYFANRRDQEQFLIVGIDIKNRPIGIVRITRGTLDASLVHPREVFRPAICMAASAIILVHNHPSGDTTPSRQDYETTTTLESAGKMLGIHVETPWGISQSSREHAPGIVFHSTASHGGYHLSDERYEQFCEIPYFAQFRPVFFPWLEEDCEAALVYLRWPELATNEQIHDAVLMARTVAGWGHVDWITFVEGWLDKPEQSLLITKAVQHSNDVKHLWQSGCMSTTNHLRNPDIKPWCVSFRRGEESRTVCMDYPTKRYYTDAELDALDQPPPLKRSPFPGHCFVGNSYDISPSDADPGL